MRSFYNEAGAKLIAEREEVRAALQFNAIDAMSLNSEWQERASQSERNLLDERCKQLEELNRRLYQLDKALDRLMDGYYGVCCECGETIERRRLKDDPASAFCLACQQILESNFISNGI